MFRIDKVGDKRNDKDEIENLEEIVFNKHKRLKSQNYDKFKEQSDDDEEPRFQIDKTGDLDNLQIDEQPVKSVWQDDDDEIG